MTSAVSARLKTLGVVTVESAAKSYAVVRTRMRLFTPPKARPSIPTTIAHMPSGVFGQISGSIHGEGDVRVIITHAPMGNATKWATTKIVTNEFHLYPAAASAT